MTPIKYVPKKINGVLMWVPVYKKGEGPSLSQKVGVPCGYLKKYEKDHRGVKDGVQVRAVCRICEKPFKYTKSKASRPRILCSAVCAYQAQKNSTKEYTARKKVAAVKGVEKPTERKVVQNTEKTTICKGCGKVFYWKQEGRHPPRKFCEEQCRLNYWIKNQAATRRTDRGVEYICKNCDKAFLHTSNQEPFQKYCTNKCRMSYNNRIESKTFVERVAEHLPTPTVVESVKDQPAPKAVVPTWEAICSDANELGVDLEAEPKNGQNFYIALLMARRAHHYEEWKRLIKSQDCRIRQYPETYIALKGVSGIGAVAAARALKARMNM
jgi:hypothetical protein